MLCMCIKMLSLPVLVDSSHLGASITGGATTTNLYCTKKEEKPVLLSSFVFS